MDRNILTMMAVAHALTLSDLPGCDGPKMGRLSTKTPFERHQLKSRRKMNRQLKKQNRH